MRAGRGVAIAGTHGKTTTTAMIALHLGACGARSDDRRRRRTRRHRNQRARRSRSVVRRRERRVRPLVPRPAAGDRGRAPTSRTTTSTATSRSRNWSARSSRSSARCPPARSPSSASTSRAAAMLARRRRSARTVTFGFGDATVAARDVQYAGFGARFDAVVEGAVAGPVTLAGAGRDERAERARRDRRRTGGRARLCADRGRRWRPFAACGAGSRSSRARRG